VANSAAKLSPLLARPPATARRIIARLHLFLADHSLAKLAINRLALPISTTRGHIASAIIVGASGTGAGSAGIGVASGTGAGSAGIGVASGTGAGSAGIGVASGIAGRADPYLFTTDVPHMTRPGTTAAR